MAEATITDVAKAAGVAASTVSRALNGGNVKAETRERIVKLARQMGYRNGLAALDEAAAAATAGVAGAAGVAGNVAAGLSGAVIGGGTGVGPTAGLNAGLAGGPGAAASTGKGNIGVFVTDIANFYFTDIFKGLFSVAQNAGYRLFMADLDVSGDRSETIRSVTGASAGQLFVSPRLSDAELRRCCDPRTTVFTNRQVEGYSSVCIDDRSGILQAVRHLASLGHRTIAYVGGADSSWANQVRGETCAEAAKSFGMNCVVVGPLEPSYAGGVNAGDALLLERDVTGVVAFNDLVATGLIGRLVERGVDIPGEMSVIGVDDSVLARVVRPQLTSVDVRQERMGALAMQMLINKLEDAAWGDAGAGDDDAPRVEMVPEILVTRESTGPAPRGNGDDETAGGGEQHGDAA
ncbi:LacI family DNA-binding transcriptional regulator [Bifidobacterium sp. 82T10]|uniref:LacI family DNA-binding transcriptional regulator n=1 Tax=Bifidobacterium miconis TaxID=2834435 RepID=A0ABS6WD65_9BIFI|nr:LacI family DNA-binding transcriptional regulator [Bifidobacterium miconis]MBW3091995.1 LacI family DNA-binding transcriptional regulator [Bifidobacterium miconis]